MSLGYVLFWLSALLVATGLFREIRSRRPERRGWLVKYLALAFLGPAVTRLIGIEAAGHVWGIAIFVLLIGPGIGLARLERLALAGQWTAARRLATTLRWLHPFDGFWRMPRLYRALELDARGAPEASTLFAALDRDPRWGVRAQVYRLRRREDWEGILALPAPDENTIATDTLPYLARLRALGECGRRAELLDAAESAATLGAPLFPLRHPILLYTFAYYGQGAAVARLLAGPLRAMPPWFREFWLLTAGLAAGGGAASVARDAFAGPSFDAYREGIGALERRRRASTPPPPNLDEQARLDRLASQLGDELAALPEMYEKGGWKRIPITAGVAGALGATFVAQELAGGSQRLDIAIALGALVVVPGDTVEPWRLFTTNFLHFGFVHVFMNVAALFALGPFVERALGGARYALVLLASGIGSMALTAYVFYAGREVVLVGASGAIMGLVGATAALLLRMRRDDRSGLVAKRLRAVALILVLQFVFDVLTPKVSLAAHAGGALCGFAAALLMDTVRQRKNR
jgi:rhomboid protease GluP